MDTRPRIGIIGAGAWGLSAAFALAEAGAANVHVWEQEQIGSGSTSRAAGLVSTHLRQESDIRLVLETRRRLEELRRWGESAERPSASHVFHRVGNLTIALRRDEDKLEEILKRVRRAGAQAELVPGESLRSKPWHIKSLQHLSVLHSEDDGYVEAGDLMDLLQARVRDLGVSLHERVAVGLRIREGRCEGVTTTEGFDACEVTLVAGGAWTKPLLASSGLQIPVKAYRTQLAQLEFPHDPTLPILHDGEQGTYARPDGDQRILVGDGTEHTESFPLDYNAATDRPFIEKVARAVSRRWEGGEAARYRTGWAGLCVGTPDRNPLIGPAPGVRRLHLMTGDNGMGVMRCLALGHIAASRLMGKMVPGAEAYAPKRFAADQDFEIREGFEL